MNLLGFLLSMVVLEVGGDSVNELCSSCISDGLLQCPIDSEMVVQRSIRCDGPCHIVVYKAISVSSSDDVEIVCKKVNNLQMPLPSTLEPRPVLATGRPVKMYEHMEAEEEPTEAAAEQEEVPESETATESEPETKQEPLPEAAPEAEPEPAPEPEVEAEQAPEPEAEPEPEPEQDTKSQPENADDEEETAAESPPETSDSQTEAPSKDYPSDQPSPLDDMEHEIDTNVSNGKILHCFVCASDEEETCATKPAKLIACKSNGDKMNGCYTLAKPDTNVTVRGCMADLTEDGMKYCEAQKKFCRLCYKTSCNNKKAPSRASNIVAVSAAAWFFATALALIAHQWGRRL